MSTCKVFQFYTIQYFFTKSHYTSFFLDIKIGLVGFQNNSLGIYIYRYYKVFPSEMVCWVIQEIQNRRFCQHSERISGCREVLHLDVVPSILNKDAAFISHGRG